MAILITGASAGFGAQMCRLFVQEGHQVIGAARRLDKLSDLAQELGENFIPLQMDVADKNSVNNALSFVFQHVEHIDLLVNNAGLALGVEPASSAQYEDWETMIQTNILGLTYVTHQLLPKMVAVNKGYIMNISSTAGSWPYKGGNVYGASKAFVRQFSLNLRTDLAGTAIRVTNIEPGLCGETEFSQVRFKGDDDKVAAVYSDVDYLTAEDIAQTVLWLYNTPGHMNVNMMEIMPISQTYGGLAVHKKTND